MDDATGDPNGISGGQRDDALEERTDITSSPAPSTADAAADDGIQSAGGNGSRDVVVPLRLYKTITVFSTLLAIGSILAGFVVLDRATRRASLAPEDVNLLWALGGLGLLAFGTVVYAFSTRFHTEAMGKPKDDTDEDIDNG